MNFDIAQMALSAGRVLLVGLLFGAGLPALFAIGMRLQSAGTGELDGEAPGTRRPLLTAAGWILFALVIAAVLTGVLFITRLSIYHYFGISLFGAGK
ncbi:MAG: hypothetical protein B7X41_19505 [Microbacterium sp. 14-71-5]|jgi:hypothetical protein|uniref:hypothetical protein n=1 Tax=Microbacterium sp. 13-71-7 TaxID=1970399 RepID=UPI000BCA5799|nr:hypothetical protein [Microbacterium sp. 13-71-7]OZB79275.1 MAG: hypothetical protein B7X41_19505 [Microbacterium sp. 14-71-5]OZB85161.1 MAG: hypothetical protein B7X32_04525 [Microbacterium sp. 13-71-7]